jgi:hypothetical protein
MKTFEVHVHWTAPIGKTSEYLSRRKVLYLLASEKEPLFIGEAGRQTLAQRWNLHRTDGLFTWVAENLSRPFCVKVGHIWMEEGVQYSLDFLRDVRTLLQAREQEMRGFCRANERPGKGRKLCRPGMIVVNHGYYRPLMRRYYDQGAVA